MPTRSRGFYACDYCGLQYLTIEEATDHEHNNCQRAIATAAARRPIEHQHLPQHQHPQQQALPQHYPHPANYFLQQQPQPQQQQHNQAAVGQSSQQQRRFSGMGPLATAEGIEAYPPRPYSTRGPAPDPGYNAYNYHNNRGISPPGGAGAGAGAGASTESSYNLTPRALSLISEARRQGFSIVDKKYYPGQAGTGNLTVVDTMACQNIEIFEATPEIIAEYERTSGSSSSSSNSNSDVSRRRIFPNQVGLRCKNCGSGSNNNNNSRNNPRSSAVGAVDFPVDVTSVGGSVRRIADRHLVSCGQTDPEVGRACQRAANKRQQRERGMSGMTEDNDNDDDDGDDRTSKNVLADYCVRMCQNMEVTNKRNNKSGIEFMTPTASGDSSAPQQQQHTAMMGGGHGEGGPIAPTPLQRRRDTTSTATPSTEAMPIDDGYSTPFFAAQNRPLVGGGATYGATPAQPNFQGRSGSGGDNGVGGVGVGGGTASSGSSYPNPQSAQQSYDPSANFPFYQERDRTWHCKFCRYVPPQFHDSQSMWSSQRGAPPPNSFIDQHLSICRVYRQQSYSYGMLPYRNPTPPHGMQPHGQPPPPPGSWEATAALGGGAIHPHHMQYPPVGLIPPHQDPNYLYGQPPPLPPGIVQPHTMESNMGGGRFLTTLGQGDLGNGYSDRRGPSIPAGPPTGLAGARGPSFGMGISMNSGDNTTDAMEHAKHFLASYEAEYYTRDPASAAIPKLVLEEDDLLLTDYFFYLMKQLRLVRFTENDRKTRGGKREKIKIGYGGLQCIHCSDLPMSRKFFWSNVDRLANSFAEIPGHVLKCRRCPQANKDALMLLKKGHPDQMSKLPRGSQKIFFRRMWRRLHEGDPQNDDAAIDSPKAPVTSENPRPPVDSIATSPEKDCRSLDDLSNSGSITVTSDETILVMQRSAREAAKALAQSTINKSEPPSPSSRILVAIPEDKEWLSDIDSYVRKQLEVFCATEDDVAAAQVDRKYPITEGQVGIRCIHCSIAQGHDAIGHAIAYPFSISGIYESVKEFHRLHLDSCPNLPATTKTKLDSMKGASSLSSVLRKYYSLAAKALGLLDTKDGIRTGGESSPIGSLAAFTFAENDDTDTSPVKSKEGNNDGERKSPGTSRSPAGMKQEKSSDEGFDEIAASRGVKRSGSPRVSTDTEQKPSKSAKREL